MIIYFVTFGPVWVYTDDNRDVWQVKAQVSSDDGKTVRSMVFTFNTEEHAIKFKRDVNFTMEPTVLGEEE